MATSPRSRDERELMVAGRTAPPDGQGASSRNVPLLVALKLQHGSDVQVFSGCDVDAAAPQDQMAVLHGGSGTAVNGHARMVMVFRYVSSILMP